MGGEKDDRIVTQSRTERCYDRCKQPKNTIVKCEACFIQEPIGRFENEDAWKLLYDHATFDEIITPTAETIFDKPQYLLRENVEMLPPYPCTGSFMSEQKECEFRDALTKYCQHPFQNARTINSIARSGYRRQEIIMTILYTDYKKRVALMKQ